MTYQDEHLESSDDAILPNVYNRAYHFVESNSFSHRRLFNYKISS